MTRAGIFLECADAYEGLVRLVGDQDWARPALGVWDVRALVGHTTRALTTVVEYLELPPPEGDDVLTAAEYFHRFGTSPDRTAAHDAVAARDVAAGAELGDAPVDSVRSLVGDARAALAAAPAGRLVATRLGTLPLEEYLRTRTFELVVHGMDLLRALDLPTDGIPTAAVADALDLATRTATLSGRGPEVLLALTGRAPLPPGLSVV